jgi:outer membrane biosynthesis protein TonB
MKKFIAILIAAAFAASAGSVFAQAKDEKKAAAKPAPAPKPAAKPAPAPKPAAKPAPAPKPVVAPNAPRKDAAKK